MVLRHEIMGAGQYELIARTRAKVRTDFLLPSGNKLSGSSLGLLVELVVQYAGVDTTSICRTSQFTGRRKVRLKF